MKKTIFLSLVAGAVIFAGCGGGGGDTTETVTSDQVDQTTTPKTDDTKTDDQANKTTPPQTGDTTYSKYVYAGTLDTPNLITTSTDGNTWIVNPDNREVGAVALDKTYVEAVAFCAEQNQSLPSPKDLLTTTLRPTDGTSASWAAGKYVSFFTENVIGQSSDQDAQKDVRKVICMKGTSIEQKHKINDLPVSADENGTAKDLIGVTDVVTGLSWTPIYTYDKDTFNPGHANQSRFPLIGATGNDITAAEYCQKFGAGWRLPTLSEARTIAYLDGTTGLKDPENLKPTVIWTSTESGDNKHYAIHLNPNGQTTMPFYSEAPEADEDKYFVTCVNPN